MAPQQKRSFLPYERGINLEDLRLGSLYLNPLDPDDGLERKRFEYQEDLEQEEYEAHIQKYIRREQKDEKGCSIDFVISKDSSLGVKFSDLIKAEGSANSTITATLEGKSGRRLKIKKPEKFLRDEVMIQEGVQEWLRTQASISFKGHFGMHRFKAPEIWMVTGVQLVTDGIVHVGSSRSVSGTVGASGDVGASFGAPPGVAAIGAEAHHGQSSASNSSYGYGGERVWAAQFMEVKIEYGSEEDKTIKSKDNGFLPATITTFQLEDIADLSARGIRASQNLRAEANGHKCVKPPKPIARIVVCAENVDEEDEEEDGDAVQFSDHLYTEALKATDWDMYSECSQYLVDAKTRRRSTTPEEVRKM
ncbi:uncharacterized protein RSE6_13725 [Rhynchosporium secalis]|uniref:MACPF domain-containing protein n=1 Tax=Rhynchosporium secalis TaxID=38038 RepID=A0A1E1MTI0_RHYSE|nr:uncharacterized protein RSE6_13725 [Rhynchosporium secalis]